MRRFFAILMIAGAPGLLCAAQDADLRQKSSVQLRAIASALRKEVEAGNANLARAGKQISDLGDWGKTQWQRAEDERARAIRAQKRVLGAFLLGGGLGGIGVGLLLRRGIAPSAEAKIVKVRVSKPRAGKAAGK